MSNKLKKGIFVLIIIIFLIVGFILFIKSVKKSVELKTILDSPIANIQLASAQEIKRSWNDKRSSLGKPIYARLNIHYRPANNYSSNDVYYEIVRNIKSGKIDKEHSRDNIYYSASYIYNSYILIIEVLVKSDENSVDLTITNRGLTVLN